MQGQSVGIIIGILVAVIIVFLICRELICWYWKINKLVALMEEQNSLLRDVMKTRGSSENSSGTNTNYVSPTPQVNFGETWTCKKCNEKNPITSSTCKSCGEYK